ncbi:hypothetical protein MY9_1519 [Bacillus sp. JS]|nr:hypothetical protein MY9_1519 [Bacillus sp. JS]
MYSIHFLFLPAICNALFYPSLYQVLQMFAFHNAFIFGCILFPAPLPVY